MSEKFENVGKIRKMSEKFDKSFKNPEKNPENPENVREKSGK